MAERWEQKRKLCVFTVPEPLVKQVISRLYREGNEEQWRRVFRSLKRFVSDKHARILSAYNFKLSNGTHEFDGMIPEYVRLRRKTDG